MSETARQAARSLQGYRIELAPTPEQRVRLAQHAGLARVAENFYLEQVRAALAQRAAEQTYGVAEAGLTRVPWSAPQLEALWRAAHPGRYPWFTAEGLSSRVPKEAARCRASALRNWVAFQPSQPTDHEPPCRPTHHCRQTVQGALAIAIK